MKMKVTKEALLEYMYALDTRADRLSTEKLDLILTAGFAELCTISNPFTATDETDLAPYYSSGENVFTIDLKENTVDIYDLYLNIKDETETLFEHGEVKNRDTNRIWRDGQMINIVHVNLIDEQFYATYDNAVVKYAYIPDADFDDMYLSIDVYLALQAAMATSLYNILHDVERATQQRAAMTRQAMSFANPFPSDYGEPGKPSMFPPGS